MSELDEAIADIFKPGPAAEWLANLRRYKCKHCGKENIFPVCNDCQDRLDGDE